MITAKTIVGLACMISKFGGFDPMMVAQNSNLTADQIAYATELALETNVCLPSVFAKNVAITKEKMASGEIQGSPQIAMPCRGCDVSR
jgi:hypothetical protein